VGHERGIWIFVEVEGWCLLIGLRHEEVTDVVTLAVVDREWKWLGVVL